MKSFVIKILWLWIIPILNTMVQAQLTLEFTVTEECPPQTLVGNLHNHASTTSMSAFYPSEHSNFQLLTQTNLFRLNKTSGDLFTQAVIDREQICPELPVVMKHHSLNYLGSMSPSEHSAYDNELINRPWNSECQLQLQFLQFAQASTNAQSNNRAHRVLIVKVVILDINDNPPSWIESRIHLSIPEHTPVGTRFPIPAAFDPDCGLTNTTSSYTLLEVNHDKNLGYFTLFQLDSELVSGDTSDRNVNFWSGQSAACPRRIFQLWLRVTRDVDFDEISKPEARTYTDSNFQSNSLHLKQIQLQLIASDGGQPGALTGSVLINITVTDINDHAPVFRLQRKHSTNQNLQLVKTHSVIEELIEIEENTPAGRTIYTAQATDVDECDLHKLTFSLDTSANSLTRSMVSINSKTGDVVLMQSPDFEKFKSFNVPLSLTDGKHRASLNLVVIVINRNDHAPIITIQPVSHTRKDITSTVDSVASMTQSLFQNIRSVTLYVREHDSPGLFIATVTLSDVDEQDDTHVLSQPPRDNVPMSLPLSPTNFIKDLPTINVIQRCQISHTGFVIRPLFEGAVNQFKVLTSTTFDREQQYEQFATLTCHDRGQPPLSTQIGLHIVIEDINDHQPVFKNTQMVAYFKENEPVHTRVYTVEASDLDFGINARLGYGLITETSDDLTIDPQTGVITSLRAFDREQQKCINVTVLVYDRADFTNNQTLPTARAFKLFDQEQDTDQVERYLVTANLLVHIQDVNDCPPVFANSLYQLSVSENAKVNQMVGQIQANDSDATELNNKVHYAIKHQTEKYVVQEFRVSPQGFIYVARGNLDREKVSSYNFYLVATDSGVPSLSSSTQVHIYVTDVNDNAPSWAFPTYNNQIINMTVSEPVGFRLAQLNAVDPDEGENGEVSYRIVQISKVSIRETFERTLESSVNTKSVAETPIFRTQPFNDGLAMHGTGRQSVTNLFELDSSSGSIYVGRSMNLDDIGSVKLVVEASDQGNPPKVSHRVLQVNIFRFLSQSTPHVTLDPESIAFSNGGKGRPRLHSSNNGGNFENDLIIIVIMVAVTLIISLALIVAILFLRCGFCPSRGLVQYASSAQNDYHHHHHDLGHTHHLEEVFRDTGKLDIDGPTNCNQFMDTTLGRYHSNNESEQMCHSFISSPGNDPWLLTTSNSSPSKGVPTGFETFKCNRLCDSTMRVHSPISKQQITGKRVSANGLSLRPTYVERTNFESPTASNSPNHDWTVMLTKRTSSRPHAVACSTFRTSCSHLTNLPNKNNVKVDDVESTDSGQGCSRATENGASPTHESPIYKIQIPTQVSTFRCLTPQTTQSTHPAYKQTLDSDNPSTDPLHPVLSRSRSGTFPLPFSGEALKSIVGTKSSADLCAHKLTDSQLVKKPAPPQGIKGRQSVTWLDPDYQTCGRSSQVTYLTDDGHSPACHPSLQDNMMESSEGTLVLFSSADPLGYAQLIHPSPANNNGMETSNQNVYSVFPTSFV